MKERTKVAVFLGGFLLSSFITLCGNGVVVKEDELLDLLGMIELYIRPTKVCFEDMMRMRRLVSDVDNKMVDLLRREQGRKEKRSIKKIIKCNADVCTLHGLKVLVDGVRRYGGFCLSVQSEQRHCAFDIGVCRGDDGVITFKVDPHAYFSATHINEESIGRYKAAGIKLNRDFMLNNGDKLKNLEKLNITMRQWIELFRMSLGLKYGDYRVILSLQSFEEFFYPLDYFKILLSKIDDLFGIELLESNQRNFASKAFKYLTRSIEYLNLGGDAIDDKFLSKLKLLELKKLVIMDCKSVTNRGLDKLVKKCPNVECLVLRGCHPDTRKIKFDLMKKLKEVELPIYKSEKDRNIEQLKEELRYLCTFLKRQGVEKINFC